MKISQTVVSVPNKKFTLEMTEEEFLFVYAAVASICRKDTVQFLTEYVPGLGSEELDSVSRKDDLVYKAMKEVVQSR